MKKIGLFLLTLVMVAGLAGCSDDDNQAERVVYATQNSDGTASPTMPAPAPAPPPPKSGPLFKDGFQYLSYVECTEQVTVCRENGVSAYPTWIIGGSRLQGYRAPAEIGSAAGCSW